MAETRNKNVPGGVAVVDEGGNLIAGAITSRIILWDAGIGPDQGPRQRHPTL